MLLGVDGNVQRVMNNKAVEPLSDMAALFHLVCYSECSHHELGHFLLNLQDLVSQPKVV